MKKLRTLLDVTCCLILSLHHWLENSVEMFDRTLAFQDAEQFRHCRLRDAKVQQVCDTLLLRPEEKEICKLV
jgi:hypothetical protein